MNHCIICNLRYLMTLTQMGVDILVNNIYAYLFLKCHHYIYMSCINWQYVLSMQILLFRPTIKKYLFPIHYVFNLDRYARAFLFSF